MCAFRGKALNFAKYFLSISGSFSRFLIFSLSHVNTYKYIFVNLYLSETLKLEIIKAYKSR